MLTLNNVNTKYATRKAREILAAGLSDRQVDETIDRLERSTDGIDRLTGISMRAILMGDDEKAFKKACKVYTKSTSEHIRDIRDMLNRKRSRRAA